MRKIFYSIILSVFVSNVIVAQCTPNNSITATGFYPSTLPDAVVGVPYSQVVQFKIPSDTTVGGFYAQVTSATLSSLTGLPNGFTSTCNVVGCTYVGGQVGCITITGTAQNNQIASYNLSAALNLTGYVSIPPLGNQSIGFNAPLTFNVLASNSVSVNQGAAFSYVKKENEILFNNLSNGTLNVKIYDVLGSQVRNLSYQVVKGESTSVITANLEAGIYIVTLQLNGKQETFKISKGLY
ncbi:MAG: T9SS type A sorting domain-containing protein [Flavobacteriales bacterium]